MSESVGADGSTGSLAEREIHDVLRNDRRRLAIEVLQDADGPVGVRELSDRVATAETNEDPPPQDKRQSVYVSLHQTHLPKLDELGIVEYEPDDRAVSLAAGVREVEVYMEVVPQYGLSWGELYFGLAFLGLLTMVAIVQLFPAAPTTWLAYVALGFFILQMGTAAYHVYSQQDRVVFQRFL